MLLKHAPFLCNSISLDHFLTILQNTFLSFPHSPFSAFYVRLNFSLSRLVVHKYVFDQLFSDRCFVDVVD